MVEFSDDEDALDTIRSGNEIKEKSNKKRNIEEYID